MTLNPEHLNPESKRVLRNRWRSIKKYAEINMRYGNEGSYCGINDNAVPSLEKDKKAIILIDEILTHVLKD